MFSTCQIFFWKKKRFSFWIWDFRDVGFEKSLHTKESRFLLYSVNTTTFAFLVILIRSYFWKNSYYTSDFGMKRIQRVKVWVKRKQRVRFWLESFTTCQILNWKFLQSVRFWTEEKHSASEFQLKETTRQILKLRKPKVLEFELKLLLHVRFGIGKKQIFGFWIWTFTTCRIPNRKVTMH